MCNLIAYHNILKVITLGRKHYNFDFVTIIAFAKINIKLYYRKKTE